MPVNKADVLACKPKTKDIDVPGLGTVRVRGLSVGARGRYRKAMMTIVDGKPTVRNDFDLSELELLLVREGTINGNGAALFGPDDDLSELDTEVVDVIIAAVKQMAGLEAEDEADIEKN